MILRVSLILAVLAGSLLAQQPSPSPSPSPSPEPSPSPSSLPSPTPTPAVRTIRELINGLKDEDVEKALQTFKEGFFDSSKVDDKEMRRAALEGLVKRLSPGAALVGASAKSSPRPQIPFLAEIL